MQKRIYKIHIETFCAFEFLYTSKHGNIFGISYEMYFLDLQLQDAHTLLIAFLSGY